MMAYENGEWIMRGVPDSDPDCIRTPDALLRFIDEVGFLPLFRNSLPGFSVEERTDPRYWWTEGPRDPWEWRMTLAAGGKVAYGKFFDRKAGFISLRWLPRFANWRRDGYDFDALWDEGKAGHRAKKIMDLFQDGRRLFSFEAKQAAGFGPEGEKNFEGALTDLEMQTYLVMSDFQQRRNRAGQPYGWHIALLAAPETVWGRDVVAAAYGEDPAESRAQVLAQIRRSFPGGTEAQLNKIMKWRPTADAR